MSCASLATLSCLLLKNIRIKYLLLVTCCVNLVFLSANCFEDSYIFFARAIRRLDLRYVLTIHSQERCITHTSKLYKCSAKWAYLIKTKKSVSISTSLDVTVNTIIMKD